MTAVTAQEESTLKDTYGNCITRVSTPYRGTHKGENSPIEREISGRSLVIRYSRPLFVSRYPRFGETFRTASIRNSDHFSHFHSASTREEFPRGDTLVNGRPHYHAVFIIVCPWRFHVRDVRARFPNSPCVRACVRVLHVCMRVLSVSRISQSPGNRSYETFRVLNTVM